MKKKIHKGRWRTHTAERWSQQPLSRGLICKQQNGETKLQGDKLIGQTKILPGYVVRGVRRQLSTSIRYDMGHARAWQIVVWVPWYAYPWVTMPDD